VIDHHLSIRAATPHDRDALSRLGQGESRTGHTLLAERHGIAIAAIALTSGRIAAAGGAGTAEAVRRLHLRRYQLLRQGGDVGPAWSLLRRLAPSAATT
jgi:hypothetical protein